MPELREIVMNCNHREIWLFKDCANGDPYDVREKRQKDKKKAAQKKAAQKKTSIPDNSQTSKPTLSSSHLNANAKAFVPPGYFVPRSATYRSQKMKVPSPLDDRTKEVDWEKDYSRVDFTRRFSISEERANPNATAATKNATAFFRSSNRKHRNINRNNIPQGKIPEIEQLILDLALDQSQLLSIRISMG